MMNELSIDPPSRPLPDVASLQAWLLALPADLVRRARFDRDGYCRVTLHRSDAFEVIVVGWLPGQETPVHGHGESVGVVRVLAGVLSEQRFRPHPEGALQVTTGMATPGDVLLETRGVVHRVRNPGSEPAVSLHVYAPPLQMPAQPVKVRVAG